MSADLDVVEIRPGLLKRWLLPILVLFTSGLLLTLGLSFFSVPRLHIAIADFLVGSLLVPLIYLKTKPIFANGAVTLVLTPEGLVDCTIPGKGLIPWEDIEGLGYVQEEWFGKASALRLRSYDAFYSSLTPKGYAKVASTIEARRRACGFELFYPWILLDRPVSQFVQLLDSFWDRYGNTTEEAAEKTTG